MDDKKKKNTVEGHMEKGDQCLAEMDYEEALDAYMRAIGMETQIVMAYEGAAKALIGLGRDGEAADILRMGLQETEDERLLAQLKALEDK